jgi:hypothetical protein
VVGDQDPATGEKFATGILVHASGQISPAYPLGFTQPFMKGKRYSGVSEGCQLVCNSAYDLFTNLTGMQVSPGNGTPQRHFTVTVNTDENKN